MRMGWDGIVKNAAKFERLSIDIWNHVVVPTLRLKLCFFRILLVLDGREERFVEFLSLWKSEMCNLFCPVRSDILRHSFNSFP